METINLLLTSLLEGTESGDIIWTPTTSCFNNDTSHGYESKSFDGKTTFKLEVKLTTKLSLETTSSTIIILNSDLVNGSKYVSSYNCPIIPDIQKAIFNKYIKPNLIIPKVSEDDVLNNILSDIGKQKIRDTKIDTILDKVKNLFTNDKRNN